MPFISSSPKRFDRNLLKAFRSVVLRQSCLILNLKSVYSIGLKNLFHFPHVILTNSW